MKILFVIATYYPEGAGSGRSVRNLAEGMQEAGHEVVVVRLTDKKRKYTEILNGVKIYYLPIRNIYFFSKNKPHPTKRMLWHMLDVFNPLAAWDFRKILKQEKPDVVNSSVIAGFSTSIFYITKMMKIRLVHTMRDYYLMCIQNGMFRDCGNCGKICMKCRPFFMFRKLAARNVDYFLGNSEFVVERHRKHGFLPQNKPCHVQWNMNEDDYIAQPRAFPEERTVKFGFIGRITQLKGIEILLEATTRLNLPNWQLVIAGMGNKDYINNIKNKYSTKNINFIGFAKPDDFYREIDILVCPSLYEEPLSRVIFEAYREALPVIAAATGGTPEIVEHGESGYLYEAEDMEKLKEYMEKLATKKEIYETMSREAAEKANPFTRSEALKSFERHLGNLIKLCKQKM